MRNIILAAIVAATPVDPILPDSVVTPGVFDSTVTIDKICVSGYSSKVRHVTDGQKNEVFKEYNIKRDGANYEVDHLISLELGGSNDTKNLWPQSYHGTWNARIKDGLENRLHTLVCDGKVALRDAQYDISHNWIKAYCKYMPSDECRGVNIE